MSEKIIDRGYLGNKRIKSEGYPISWTEEMINEWLKCKDDPIYFSEKYIKIVHVDRGFESIVLYDFQKEIINLSTNNRRVIANCSRQSGKCLYSKSFINIRNKETGEIEKITVEDFYNLMKLKNETS